MFFSFALVVPQTRADAPSALYQGIYTSSPDSVDKAHRLAFLRRLSKASELLPSTFYLDDVKIHHGQKVFMKKYRVYNGSMTEEERAELLNREAIVWANHQHKGVLPFLGVFQRGNDAEYPGLYLVSPFLEHGTIISYLESRPTANRQTHTGLRYSQVRDILGAMAFLHKNNIIHGDIKGVNVLVDSSGRACVADLGFSRLTSAAVLTWTSLRSVATVATVPWQAPELLECILDEDIFGSLVLATRKNVDGSEQRTNTVVKPTKEADVYSIGCFAYEVFTDKPPFWDFKLSRIIVAVVIDKKQPTRPEPLSNAYSLCGLTDELWCMMESCWAREPSLRPTTCQLSDLPCFKDLVDNRPPREN
ncbi:hypothetical protein NMY22_g14130 [Coprinellus aureogranulatus]|nr:hypothetical protein NMY22_g14130 [Coprinellus aureogranulatus]